jgi:hypothetical protein
MKSILHVVFVRQVVVEGDGGSVDCRCSGVGADICSASICSFGGLGRDGRFAEVVTVIVVVDLV